MQHPQLWAVAGRAPRIGAAAAAADATLAAGRADRERDRLALQAPFQTSSSPCPEMLRLWLSGWRICTLCETISGPRRRRWRPRRPSTNRWPTRRDGPSALGGCRLRQRQHKSICLTLFDQDQPQTQQPRTQQSSRCPLLQPIPQICSYGRTVRIMCKQVTKLTKIRFEVRRFGGSNLVSAAFGRPFEMPKFESNKIQIQQYGT
jgi:hypothetical protein